MGINLEVERHIDNIRHDSLHGASALSRQAMKVIGLAIEKSEADTVSLFLEDLKQTGKKLVESKPSMASLANCVSRLIYDIYRESGGETDLLVLKHRSSFISRDLLRTFEEAFQKTAEQGAEMIWDGDRIMTCSFSSTICQAFRIARFEGKSFSVLASESRFGNKSYGELTSEELRSYGIEVQIVEDKAIKDYIPGADKVLVGADSLLSDGSLVNGVPTYRVALAARENHIPLYALCEKVKLDARSYLGRPAETERGFDRVPPHLIEGIITEEGLTNREKLLKFMEEMEVCIQILF